MSATTERLSIRASSVRDCVRKALYEASGAPARERSPREERFLYRGKSLGRDYTIFLASSNGWKIEVDSGPDYWVPPDLLTAITGGGGIVAEKKIPWGYGTGHADAFIRKTRTIVECLSSAHASDEMIRSKLLQAVLYTEHDKDATNCRLVVIDPSDFSEEQVVLDPRSRQYAELVEEMRARVDQVEAWQAGGELPDRVCRKPSEAIGHFCQHAEHCFEGWEPPPLEEIAADPELLAAVAEFARIKSARAGGARVDKQLELEQKRAQKIIEAAELPPGLDVMVGPYKVTRSAVQRKPSFEWEKAEAAGVFEPGLYDAEFWREGASYSTFRAIPTEAVPAEDYGDVPF